jgi:hypothetical protein
MLTRFAIFEGHVSPDNTHAFRSAVLTEILPHWTSFPGVLAVRVCFTNECDAGAAEIPLILAINYANRAAIDTALASPQRALAVQATESVLARYFSGRVHHHITEANEHLCAN